MMKLPTKPKTRVRKNEQGHYEITLLFPMEDRVEFDNLIAAALKETDRVIDSNWEEKTVTLVTQDINAFEKRINFYRIMGSQAK